MIDTNFVFRLLYDVYVRLLSGQLAAFAGYQIVVLDYVDDLLVFDH